MDITVLLPAYKEAENLKLILPKIHSELKKHNNISYEILVVDTQKPMDDTHDICIENNAKYIARKGGDFYGDAIRTGISKASGDRIVVMDADGSHNPADIIRLYDKAEQGFDVVIGSRYMNGGETYNGFILRTMSSTVNIVYRIIFKINAKDISNSFRIYDATKLKTLNLVSRNFDIVEEILVLLGVKYPDYRLTEIPISFNKRLYGESKRNLIAFSLSYIQSIIRMLQIKKKASKNE